MSTTNILLNYFSSVKRNKNLSFHAKILIYIERRFTSFAFGSLTNCQIVTSHLIINIDMF